MLLQRIKGTIVKDYNSKRYLNIDEHDFEIRPLRDTKLIDSISGLDDECEFQKDMFNFGDDDDLPDSDKAMNRRCKNY